jgi:hypothetical protein
METIVVSVGELLDKLTILEIKKIKIKDEEKIIHIEKERSFLSDKSIEYLKDDKIKECFDELLVINSKLWAVEDILRDMEAESRFDNEFIENARLVYKTNDKRFEVKNRINDLTNSAIKEQKSYKKY